MEIVSSENLKGQKCVMCIDSVKQDTLFFLAFLNGAGVISLSVEKKSQRVRQCGLLSRHDGTTVFH
jgi:hypothetical protein